jgi:hypothetical protein
MKLRAVAAVLLLLAGCVSSQPLQANESFRFDVSCRTFGERIVTMDATCDFSQLGAEIALDDVTTVDDKLDALHRIRIGGLRPQPSQPPGRRGGPTSGHIEWRELGTRSPVELVLEYKGHRDVYHVSFLQPTGIAVDPPAGEFSRIFVR